VKNVVLDTNVIISAFFWEGHSRAVYDLIRGGKIRLLFSSKMEAELIRVLIYPKFGLTPAEIVPLVNNPRRYVHFIEIKSKLEIIKDDPTDNIFLEWALD
jgi:putative PIN family toxin of toxin-antitoxin system